MTGRAVPRWALSFADLTLLLLGFFVMLYASTANMRDVAASTRAAFGGEASAAALLDGDAAAMFEPGEARLVTPARERLRAIGARATAAGWTLTVESVGRDATAHRFDGWELAAARAAAVARGLQDGGLAEDRVEIAMPSRGPETGQRLTIRH